MSPETVRLAARAEKAVAEAIRVCQQTAEHLKWSLEQKERLEQAILELEGPLIGRLAPDSGRRLSYGSLNSDWTDEL